MTDYDEYHHRLLSLAVSFFAAVFAALLLAGSQGWLR